MIIPSGGRKPIMPGYVALFYPYTGCLRSKHTVIHVHLYLEGCVIICGFLWGARYLLLIGTAYWTFCPVEPVEAVANRNLNISNMKINNEKFVHSSEVVVK